MQQPTVQSRLLAALAQNRPRLTLSRSIGNAPYAIDLQPDAPTPIAGLADGALCLAYAGTDAAQAFARGEGDYS